MRIGVVGGGIGGLSAAIALARDGHEIEVFERAPRFEPIGAGIVISANGSSVLYALGVDLAGVGAPFTRFEVRTGAGQLVSRVPTGAARAVGLGRPELHERLVAALPEGVRVRLWTTVTACEAADDWVRLSWVESGESARHSGSCDAAAPPCANRGFDLVVGADGLRSGVREAVAGQARLRYSGQTCWRWRAPVQVGERAVEWWAPGHRVGAVPIAGGEAYLYLVADAAAGASGPVSAPELGAQFAELPDAAYVVATLDAVPDLHHDLYELPSPVWGSGRVVLLGDAAHAMTPNLGQGAAMAIEDAAGLTLVLRGGDDAVVPRYRRLRALRVWAVQVQSRRIGQLSHWSQPVARLIRDAAFSAIPEPAARMQYRSLVAPGLRLAERL